MATVKIKYSTTPSSTPSGLTTGEMAVNIHERRVFIGSTGGIVDITGVRTFNGLTGDVTGVATSVANTFTALQTFSAGLSASGATFGSDIGVNGVRIGRGGGNISSNTVLGSAALEANTTGTQNVAIGIQALNGATNAGGNIAIGRRALFATTAGDNVGIGNNAATNLAGGSENVYIGSGVAANSGSSQNEIVIGANTTGRGSNTVTIGNSSVVTTFVSGVLNASSGISASGGITFGGTVASDTGYRITSNAINAQTGTTYTFLSTDNGKIITMNNSSGITAEVPTGLPTGFNCTVIQLGSGRVGFTGSSGVTLNSYGGLLKISGQHGAVTVVSYSSNVYNIAGTLST